MKNKTKIGLLCLASLIAGGKAGEKYMPIIARALKPEARTETVYNPSDNDLETNYENAQAGEPNELEAILKNLDEFSFLSIEKIMASWIPSQQSQLKKTGNNMPEIKQKYYEFPEEELDIINYTASRVGVDANLLKAIRKAENGGKGLEFGIIPTEEYKGRKGYFVNGKFTAYASEFEKQCSWCAWTIKRNLERFQKDPEGKTDFIAFLGERYSPLKAENDSDGLNKNWISNVRRLYSKYSSN